MSLEPSSPVWHSIRPWHPPKSAQLTLNVREITSVSATFILSVNPDDFDDELENHDCELTPENLEDKQNLVGRALASSLSVQVDGTPWRRVLRVDDKRDESVIIIYGLMPGRQYDIDLELVQEDGVKNSLRRQVVTEDVEPATELPPSSPTEPDVAESSVSPASESPQQPSPSSPLPTPPLTLEDRIAHLQLTLSFLTDEHNTLTSQLKSTKIESRKADNGLRTEIEVLKRSSDKHSAGEQRAKQRALALQESIKRAQGFTKDMVEKTIVLESSLPKLREERVAKESVYKKALADADKVAKQRQDQEEKDRRQAESHRNELAAMTNKLEKLVAKQEKIEKSIIPELEEELARVREEIERENADTLGSYHGHLSTEDDADVLSGFSFPRHRTQSNSSSVIGRPPPNGSALNGWSAASSRHNYSANHNQRSSSINVTPTILTNPNRQNSLPKLNGNPVFTSSTTSTLSSRAPPFEPGKPIQIWPSVPQR